jgi:hypothetical protein
MSAPTKASVLAGLRASGDEALRDLRATPEATYAQGRYENGWNARQILAHVATIEWTYPRLIDLAQASGETSDSPAPAARPARPQQTSPDRPADPRILSYNERQVAKRAGASIAELIDEFARNRAATVAAVEAADEALFSRVIRSAGGMTGTLAAVLDMVAVQHVRMHVADITGAPWTGARI